MPLRSWVVSTMARPSACKSASRWRTSWRVRDVDARGGLVEEQDVGSAEQGPGDEHPLLLAPGQLSDVTAGRGRRCRAVRGRRPPRSARRGWARATPVVGAGHQHDLGDGDGELPVDRLHLRHVAGPQPAAGVRRAPGRGDRAEQDAQQCRLARTRRPDDADEPRRRRPSKSTSSEHRLLAVAVRHRLQAQQGADTVSVTEITWRCSLRVARASVDHVGGSKATSPPASPPRLETIVTKSAFISPR